MDKDLHNVFTDLKRRTSLSLPDHLLDAYLEQYARSSLRALSRSNTISILNTIVARYKSKAKG